MYMTLKALLLFLLSFGITHAQNLVLNPSFETHKRCFEIIGQFDGNVKNWSTPNYGSTDYFHVCSASVGEINYLGYQKPKSGKGYTGIYVLAPENYREYVQGQLSSTLHVDKNYKITFYISLAENSINAIKDMAIIFTETEVKNTNFNIITQRNLTKSKLKFEYVSIKNDSFYTQTKEWIKVSTNYKAKGFEKYFAIGNFDSNRKIKKLKVRQPEKKYLFFSYYYIDEVGIKPLDSVSKIPLKKHETTAIFKPETTYTFKNVIFDFDKAELLNTTINELDKLSLYLKENKHLYIEIYGHTDNIGLTKRNEELSLLRASAVSHYLIKKGLKPQRITWFGFGSSKPIVVNSSQENRAINRRVEFKLIDKN